MSEQFEMVAKTFKGLEGVLADELTALGAHDVMQGTRVVSFFGDKEMMYRANFCCRTALRVLKPIKKFRSNDADDLYEQVKAHDWTGLLSENSTFSISSTVYSDKFRHSHFVTYRVKDGIADFFMEHCGKRPSIRLTAPDMQLDVHISGDEVTISLDTSGEPLYKRGWREAQTEAPINEVLAAGILLLAGWDGSRDLVDPMCGSGTFLIEAAMIATGTYPGIFGRDYAFQKWDDYDAELFESIYQDDSNDREFTHKIYGSDLEGKAIAISRLNVNRAGVARYVELTRRAIEDIEEVPPGGMLVTNPPYGTRLSIEEIEELYATIGSKLKSVFKGYDAWVIGVPGEIYDKIGLRPSVKYELLNGDIECELRQFVIFDGTFKDLRREGGSIKNEGFRRSDASLGKVRRREFKPTDERPGKPRRERGERASGAKRGFGDRPPRRKEWDSNENPARKDRDGEERKPRRFGDKSDSRKPRARKGEFIDKENYRPGEHRDKRPYAERGRDSNDESKHGTWHFRKVSFKGPRLGKEAERPIVHGRRNKWKRTED